MWGTVMNRKIPLKNIIRQISFQFLLSFVSSFLWAAEEGSSTGFDLGKIINLIVEYVVKYSFQVLGGIIILIAGWIVARFICKFVDDFLKKHKIDVTIAKFIVSTVRLVIMAFAGLIALGKFGIEIAPFIAGLSVIGFGTSFALQGPLSNYAAGATLIFTKPFKVGDIIEVVGVAGEVEDMTLPRTILRTVDGVKIVVPNKHIIGEIIQNYSELKRLDIKVGIGYKSDVDKAIKIVHNIIQGERRILKRDGQESAVGILEFADSSINLEARVCCRQADYWDVLFSVNKKILDEFNKNGITIPFPQRDVHLYQQKG